MEWVFERPQSGDLNLGNSVAHPSITHELAVSLHPVTEALQQLKHKGPFESRPRVGMTV